MKKGASKRMIVGQKKKKCRRKDHAPRYDFGDWCDQERYKKKKTKSKEENYRWFNGRFAALAHAKFRG